MKIISWIFVGMTAFGAFPIWSDDFAAESKPRAYKLIYKTSSVFLVGTPHFTTSYQADTAGIIVDTFKDIDSVVIEAIISQPIYTLMGEVFKAAASDRPVKEMAPIFVDCVRNELSLNAQAPADFYQKLSTLKSAAALVVLASSPRLAPSGPLYFGVEHYVRGWAQKNGKSIEGLEADDGYLRGYLELSDVAVERLMGKYCAILASEKKTREVVKLTDGFVNLISTRMGNVDAVRAAALEFEDRIFGEDSFQLRQSDARSVQMADSVFELFARKRCVLVFVGSLHLSGQSAIQKRLAGRGVSVTQIDLTTQRVGRNNRARMCDS